MGRWILSIAATLIIVIVSTCATPVDIKTVEYRLPANVIPLHYDIKLTPLLESDQSGPKTFEGEVEITISVLENTQTVTLHYNDMEIHNVIIEDVNNNEINTQSLLYDQTTHFLVIQRMDTDYFESGSEYLIKINYTGNHRDDMYGFYRSHYKVSNGIRWIATTQFQPTHARRAFPCFDEPALKANFTIHVKKEDGRHTLTNMPLRTDIVDDEWEHFETTPKMSSYLIAIIVSDFNWVGDEKYKIWARQEAMNQTHYSFSIAEKTINAMEKLLKGSKYTMPKMDEVAVPDFSAGAMENWGLCTYRERLILYDESAANAAHKQSIATVVAHEFAHQWFGDLVGPEWWKYLWLNEGFATYYESFATDLVETTWRLKEQFVVTDVQSSFGFDSLESTHPMTQDVTSPDSIRSIFDTISYAKAGSVIRMMEHFVTTEVFQEGLKNYVEERNHNYANEDHLYAEIDKVFQASNPSSYENVTEVMHTWTRQAGFPLLTVTSAENNLLSLTQNRFIMKRTPTTRVDSVWSIPLTYVVQDGDFSDTSTKQWMKESSMTMDKPSESGKWHIFNVQETGYYRVNYDDENWNLLIEYLATNDFEKIHSVNRAQLLDDALNLARGGVISYDTALSITRYLSQETDYIPWYSALTGLSYLKLRLTGTSIESNFKEYVLKLIAGVYNDLGFEDNGDHVTKLHRSMILQWACELDHDHCIQAAHEKFNAAMSKDSASAIPADLQSVTYCTVVRHGTEIQWNNLWEKYVNSNYATEQTIILTALGCTTNQTLINNYLEKSITPDADIRRQDSASVFSSVYTNPAGVELALNFLVDRFKDIQDYYGGGGYGVTNIINALASRISTTDQLEKFKNFVTNTDLGPAAAAAQRAIETAEENLQWTEHYLGTIGEWLANELITQTSTASTSNELSSQVNTEETTSGGDTLFINTLITIVITMKAINSFVQ
ncbi:Aminopeptidase N [Blattella germanica]|nr:Aminopeptidase N [Blattella germanica]